MDIMKIVFCGDKFKNDIIKIWEYCFNDTKEYAEFYFSKKYVGDDVIGVLDDEEQAIGSISLNKHVLSICGKVFDIPYVVGVSTLPEARGNGIMRDAMMFSLEAMYKRGAIASILMPIDARLYTGYGYSNCYDMLNVEMDVFDLRKFKLTGDFKAAKNLKCLDDKQLDKDSKDNQYSINVHDLKELESSKTMIESQSAKDLLSIYQSALANKNGYSVRSVEYFQDFITEMEIEGGYVYINYIDGMPTGYLAYSISNGEMFVREFYYTSIKSYKSMLKFIFNHNTQAKKIKMTVSADDKIMQLLDNPKDSKFEIKAFMMARIIDFERFVEKVGFDCEEFEPFYLKVVDKQLTNNDGVFKIYCRDNKLQVVRDNTDKEADLELDISYLNQLMFGYMDIEEVEELSECKKIKRAKNAFSKIKSLNHINEYV